MLFAVVWKAKKSMLLLVSERKDLLIIILFCPLHDFLMVFTKLDEIGKG